MSGTALPGVLFEREIAPAPARGGSVLVEFVPDAPLALTIRQTTRQYPIARHGTSEVEVLVAGTVFDAASLATLVGLPASVSIARAVHEAYLRLGDQFLEHVVGRFAVLVADRRSRRLVAVRDQMGVFPLFYCRTGCGLLLSTSVADLTAQPEVSREINRLVVAEHLVHRWIDAHETYFADVWRVPPGQLLEVVGGGETLRRYWNPGADGPFEPMADDEAIERFDHHLRRAVSRCLGSSRTGILLSGGFDSVSVAATATALTREGGRPAPHALSVVFPDPECDEQVVQRGVARTLGLTQDLLPLADALRGRGLLESALELGRSWPTPMLNLWSPAYLEMARRSVREGCDTILTGTGGDEWLNVTPCIAADLIRRGEFGQLVYLLGVFQRSFRMTRLQLVRSTFWTFGLRRLLGSAVASVAPSAFHANRHRREIAKTPPWVAPDPVLRREMDARAERLIPSPRPGERGFYDYELQVALGHPLVAVEYEEHFEFGQQAGVSLLSPYLDPHLITFLYRLSPLTLTTGGRSKGLVRSAMSRAFPDLGFERHKKVNADAFFRNVVATEGPVQWQRSGGAPALTRMGVLDGPQFEQEAAGLFAGRDPKHNHRVWDTLNVNAWVSAHSPAS